MGGYPLGSCSEKIDMNKANIDRVALFMPSLRGGGAERVMVILANEFVARGFAVDLVLANAEGPYYKDVDKKINIVNLGAARVLMSLPGLIKYLRTQKPSVMLSALNHANVVAIVAKLLATVNTRLWVSEHNALTRSIQNRALRRERWLPYWMSLLYPFADGVIAVSNGVADDLARTIKLPRNKIQVIYNPIYSEGLLQLATEQIDDSCFSSFATPVLLAAGRLTEQKGFTVLIQAFRQLRKDRAARLVILGDGEERSMLQSLIDELGLNDDVVLLGFKSNPIAYMKKATVFVLSSNWEGFGNVLVEAMACGTAVISTDCPSGPSEILEGGKWGRLVAVGDADALAYAIKETLDETVHPDVAKRARDFSVCTSVDRYLSVMNLSIQ